MNDLKKITINGVTYDVAPGSHLEDKDNPHGVTAEQAGAAPAGYGLGVLGATMPALLDLDSATKIGWYYANADTANNPLAVGGVVEVQSSSANNLVQTLKSSTASKFYGVKLQRVRLQGTWQEWEWINPPMILGTEYRTTERCNGKAVYTKLIDCGKMPNNTQVAIPHGISMDKVIRHCGYGGSSTIPYSTTVWNPTATTHSVDVAVSTYAIYIRTNYDASAESAMIQIWYTKS